MPKLRKPSQHSIDLYNQLVDIQNQIRKKLKRMHKNAEEVSGAGRLPALVIPKSAHKIRRSHFEGLSPAELRARLKMYWARYKTAKELFSGGLNSYLAKTVMKGYKELWLNGSGSFGGIGEKPEGYFGRFSKEQIENSDMGRAMEVYNLLFTHGTAFFMALLYTDKIIDFKWIYDDLTGKVEANTYLNQQIDNVVRYLSPKNRADLMKQAQYVTGEYKHSKRAKERANYAEKQANARKRNSDEDN